MCWQQEYCCIFFKCGPYLNFDVQHCLDLWGEKISMRVWSFTHSKWTGCILLGELIHLRNWKGCEQERNHLCFGSRQACIIPDEVLCQFMCTKSSTIVCMCVTEKFQLFRHLLSFKYAWTVFIIYHNFHPIGPLFVEAKSRFDMAQV